MITNWTPVPTRPRSTGGLTGYLGKALATVEIRYLATFWDQAKQIVSW